MTGAPLALLRDYPHGLTVFLVPFFLSLFLTGLCFKIARSLRLLPAIRGRDVHTERKPRVGGVAMWLSVAISFAFVALAFPGQGLLDFRTAGNNVALDGLIVGMAVILVTGLLDDMYSLPPLGQLAGQILAAGCLVAAGIGIMYVQLPFGHALHFDTWIVPGVHLLDGSVLVPFSAAATVLWVVVIMNVMNFFDGLDGLAASVTMTASIILLLVSLRVDVIASGTLALILMGAAAGFLPWNWHPSKLFMGTVGSQLLGFVLAVAAIISGAKVATAILVLGLPLLDAALVIAARLYHGQSPFQADRRHLHHRLLRLGLSTTQVVLFTNGFALLFGILALIVQTSNAKGFLILLLVFVMLLTLLAVRLLERRESGQLERQEGKR
jgi:UDP-N-acetylmuramyl pentapeptide phosphotransferase/UDP-N-acetylglucosamine-1-phosphate transferase